MTTIREVVVKVRLEQVQARLAVPDTRAVHDEIAKISREYREALNPRVAGGGSSGTAAGAAATRQAVIATNDLSQSSMRVAGSLKQAGEGAFIFARGLAFLTAGSDENLRSAIRNIAAVQGLFDLYRGGVQIVSGLSKANATLAASNAAVAASSTAAASAAASLTQIAVKLLPQLGPIALGIVAIGGVMALMKLPERAEEFEELAEAIRKVKQAGADLDRSLQQQRFELLSPEDQVSQVLQKRSQPLPDVGTFAAVQEEAARIAQRQLGLGSQGVVTDETRLALAQEFVNKGEEANRQLEERKTGERVILDYMKEQGDAKRRELEQAQRTLDTATKQLAVEDRRLQSLDEIVGRMKPAELRRLEQIERNAAAGKTTRRDLAFLDERGIGSEFTSREFAKAGREATGGQGARKFGTILGPELSEIDTARAPLLASIAKVSEVHGDVKAAMEHLNAQTLLNIQAQKAIVDGVIANQQKLGQELTKANEEIAKVQIYLQKKKSG